MSDGLAGETYAARVHHIDPVSVITKNIDFYRQLYGNEAGRAFGMSADFSDRGAIYTDAHWAAKPNGT